MQPQDGGSANPTNTEERQTQDAGVKPPLQSRTQDAGLAGAGGFDPIEAEEGEGAAQEFGPGAAFAEEEDAQGGSGDREEIGEGGKLRSLEETEKPEVEEIGECGAEKAGVEDAGPSLPRDGAPVGERAECHGAVDGDGEKEESTKDEIPSGHGERVVVSGDALAENDVHGKGERADERENITEKRGGMAGDTGASGEDDDAGESNEHAEGFADGGTFETEEDGKDEGVDGTYADDDGRVRDVCVAEGEAEEELVERDTKESDVGEGPVITPGSSLRCKRSA